MRILSVGVVLGGWAASVAAQGAPVAAPPAAAPFGCRAGRLATGGLTGPAPGDDRRARRVA